MRWDGRVEGRDDAGKAVTLLTASALGRDPRKVDPAFERMTRRVGQIYGLGFPQVVGGVAGAGFALVFTVGTRIFDSYWGIGLGFVFACFLAHGVRIGMSLWARKNGDQIATAMLAVGVCPSCGYSLAGLESQDECLLDCPECGASWSPLKITNPRHFRDVSSSGKAHRRFLQVFDKPGVATLEDDRGGLVPLVGGQLRAEIATAEDDEHRRKLVEARREIAPSGHWRRRAVSGAFILFGVLMGLLPAYVMTSVTTRIVGLPGMAPPDVRPLLLMGLLPMAMFGFVAVIMLRGNWCFNPVHVRDVMLGKGLCPSCSAELVAGDVGLCVCQDCGAAWELSGRLVERGEVR